MHEGTHCATHGRSVQVRVVKDDGSCLASQFEQDGLHVLARCRGNDGTDLSAACKVDLPDRRMGDQSRRNRWSI